MFLYLSRLNKIMPFASVDNEGDEQSTTGFSSSHTRPVRKGNGRQSLPKEDLTPNFAAVTLVLECAISINTNFLGADFKICESYCLNVTEHNTFFDVRQIHGMYEDRTKQNGESEK